MKLLCNIRYAVSFVTAFFSINTYAADLQQLENEFDRIRVQENVAGR